MADFFDRLSGGPSLQEAGATTISDLIAPASIDTHSPDYVLVDGVYHTYLYIAGYGYATVVGKGWLTGLIEAGEGVSLSFQLRRQPREKTVSAISQATMVNRFRMWDMGDTRQDFEELGDAIYAGTYLKEGMNREREDFYYMHVLIEVVADDPETLERRVNAVETLCVASDMLAKRCEFKHEQAFLSWLSDNLQLATVYAATGFATVIIVQNGDVGTALLSDELWKLLGANSNPLAADYTMQMVKIIRSQGGIAGVTSQGMANMMALDGGKYGKGILDSCRVKIILQMEEQEARLVQEKLDLTESLFKIF